MSSGERNRNSLNLYNVIGYSRCYMGVVGADRPTVIGQEVTKLIARRDPLERGAIESESLVVESH